MKTFKIFFIGITSAILLAGCPDNFNATAQQVNDAPHAGGFNNSALALGNGQFAFFWHDKTDQLYMRKKSAENNWDGPSRVIDTMTAGEKPSDAAILSDGNIIILSKLRVYENNPNTEFEYNYNLITRLINPDGDLFKKI